MAEKKTKTWWQQVDTVITGMAKGDPRDDLHEMYDALIIATAHLDASIDRSDKAARWLRKLSQAIDNVALATSATNHALRFYNAAGRAALQQERERVLIDEQIIREASVPMPTSAAKDEEFPPMTTRKPTDEELHGITLALRKQHMR